MVLWPCLVCLLYERFFVPYERMTAFKLVEEGVGGLWCIETSDPIAEWLRPRHILVSCQSNKAWKWVDERYRGKNATHFRWKCSSQCKWKIYFSTMKVGWHFPCRDFILSVSLSPIHHSSDFSMSRKKIVELATEAKHKLNFTCLALSSSHRFVSLWLVL